MAKSKLAGSVERRMMRDAGLLLHCFEARKKTSSRPTALADLDAAFVPMTRRTYRNSPHLDRRIVTSSPRVYRVAVSRLARRLDSEPSRQSPPGFLFHTAFCGSSLVANCLDRPGSCLTYKEPLALSQLCLSLTRDGEDGAMSLEEWNVLATVSTRLLSKTFEPTERAVIKASHPGSLAMRKLLSLTASRAIFVHSDLRSFLCAILKSEGRRQWLRAQLKWVHKAAASIEALAAIDPEALDDAEAAAYVWLWQVHNYMDASQELGSDVLRSLSFDSFLERPRETLIAAGAFLSTPISESEASRTVSSDRFRTYSKRGIERRGLGRWLGRVGLLLAKPQAYDKTSRQREQEALVAKYGEELQSAVRWAEGASPRAASATQLPFAVGEEGARNQ